MSPRRLALGYSVLLLVLLLAWFYAPTDERRSVVCSAVVLLTVLFRCMSGYLRDGPPAVRRVLGWAVSLVITWVALTPHLAAGPAWELEYRRAVVGLLIVSYLGAWSLDRQAILKAVSAWREAAIGALKSLGAMLRALAHVTGIFFVVGGLGFCVLEYLRQQVGREPAEHLVLVAFLLLVFVPVRSVTMVAVVTRMAVMVTLGGTYGYWVFLE